MERIVLATRNPDKVREIRAILSAVPVELVDLDNFPGAPEVVEDGKTLEANALKKAREIVLATSIPAIADDTGLEVFELDLRPGVYSSRYAGEDASYADNCRKLVSELRHVPESRRGARFRCIAVFTDGRHERIAEGICHGKIIDSPHGAGGFGYDPLFVPDGYSLTFAELPPDIKNRISHRAKAFAKMAEILSEYYPNR
ncbi:MAG TPA: RdgB/HAM1 family non-canonical purine NTP pyrophosphatase [Bacteroidota bacterium]|nr:RdgB/HAM1 family non-canonical purine NTP pyrophosphatase [Bacteroidota bacterium]